MGPLFGLATGGKMAMGAGAMGAGANPFAAILQNSLTQSPLFPLFEASGAFGPKQGPVNPMGVPTTTVSSQPGMFDSTKLVPTLNEAPVVAPTVERSYLPKPATQPAQGAAAARGIQPDLARYGASIKSIESGSPQGNYRAIGARHPKYGRALGAYQVMEANVGPWSEEILGRRLTADEFLADDAAQDAIFYGKFGEYIDRYGTPEDAASAWFTGSPRTASSGKRADVHGTTGNKYVQMFTSNLNKGTSTGTGASPTRFASYRSSTPQRTPMQEDPNPPETSTGGLATTWGQDAEEDPLGPIGEEEARLAAESRARRQQQIMSLAAASGAELMKRLMTYRRRAPGMQSEEEEA